MKKALLFILLLSGLTVTTAQSYKIMNTAHGEFQGIHKLYDYVKGDVYGYAEFILLDKTGEKTYKYKFNLLDKNLNKVVSKEFEQPVYYKKSKIHLQSVDFNDGYIFIVLSESINSYVILKYYLIYNTKENKIIKRGLFHDNATFDGKTIKSNSKHFKPRKDTSPAVSIIPLDKTGFLVRKKDVWASFYDYEALDFEGNSLWDKSQDLELFYVHDNGQYIIFEKNVELGSDNVKLIYYNVKTGDKVASGYIPLRDNKYYYNYFYRKFDKENGKLTLMGTYRKKRNGHSLGVFKMEVEIDKRKLKPTHKVYFPYSKFGFADINEYGKIKREGYLTFSKIDINPDGTIFMIAETRFKSAGVYKSLYSILLDKEFSKVLEKKTYITEKSKGRKYAFSQKLLNNKGKAYFFYDKDSKKDYKVHILKLYYADKSIETSSFNIDLRKSVKLLEPAKAGYIMIYEIFKNPGKGEPKLELRLEKIN